jgi:hypothetical protein
MPTPPRGGGFEQATPALTRGGAHWPLLLFAHTLSWKEGGWRVHNSSLGPLNEQR